MKVVAVVVGLLMSSAAFGSGFVCKKKDKERHVTIVWTKDEGKAPCEVRYDKTTEGGEKVIWKAKNDGATCKTRAKSFIDKLSKKGWACGEQA